MPLPCSATAELEERLWRGETASLLSARPEFHPDFVKEDKEGSLSSMQRCLLTERELFLCSRNGLYIIGSDSTTLYIENVTK